MASQLTDAFARKFYYLRLSITDVCNFRCTYCLPDGYKPGSVTNNGFLSVDEVRRVTRAFSELGTEKVRLTGGEPSLRRDFPDIIAAVRENERIRQIAVTTNGYRMARDVGDLARCGLNRYQRQRGQPRCPPVSRHYRAGQIPAGHGRHRCGVCRRVRKGQSQHRADARRKPSSAGHLSGVDQIPRPFNCVLSS